MNRSEVEKEMVDYYKTFKVYLFAGKDVGKKSLANISEKLFDDETGLTLGVEWFLKNVVIDGNERIKLQIWVNINDKSFDNLWKQYLLGAVGVILMYDITNAKSLDFLSIILQDVKKAREKYDFPILLVGNKLDLEQNREVSKEQVEKFKEDYHISESLEISLKTGENVENMFRGFAEMIL